MFIEAIPEFARTAVAVATIVGGAAGVPVGAENCT
jgi:hypothetical protein